MKIVCLSISRGTLLQTISVYDLSEDKKSLVPIEIKKCDYNNIIKEAIATCEDFDTKIIKCNNKGTEEWFKNKGYILLDDVLKGE